MKILGKRIIACAIDALVIGLAGESVSSFFTNSIYDIGNLSRLFIFVPYVLKDTFFKNASLGKKIMGIFIMNDNWNTPSKKTLIMRAVLTNTVGYFLLGKSAMITGDYIELFDWERDVIKTVVIDKKIYKKLQDEVGTENKQYVSKMSNLYAEYLRNIYLK